jgi:hypothetical protein
LRIRDWLDWLKLPALAIKSDTDVERLTYLVTKSKPEDKGSWYNFYLSLTADSKKQVTPQALGSWYASFSGTFREQIFKAGYSDVTKSELKTQFLQSIAFSQLSNNDFRYLLKISGQGPEYWLSILEPIRAKLSPEQDRAFGWTANKVKAFNSTLQALLGSPENLGQPELAAILKQQDLLESKLLEVKNGLVTAQGPPSNNSWQNELKHWVQFISTLPTFEKRNVTFTLLTRIESDANKVSQFISKLAPEPGVIEAVQLFLSNSPLMNSNRTDFSQIQVTSMFGGDRFLQFFPHLFDITLTGAIRTKFMIAVKTSPIRPANHFINFNWLMNKLDENDVNSGASAALGFRPALNHSRFESQLRANFDVSIDAEWKNPRSQYLGLTVQAGYDRSGFSLMDRLIQRRGQVQFEEEVGPIVSKIEEHLTTGVLAKADELERRLFVLNWRLIGDNDIVNAIRNDAERLENLSGFWNLRVEIHNFPSIDTLRRVKEFANSRKLSATADQIMKRLIQNIEQLHGIGAVGNNIAQSISNLTASGQTKQNLLKLFENIDSFSPIETLERLASARRLWKKLKLESGTSSLRVSQYYYGDQQLSQLAMVQASKSFESHLDFASSIKLSEAILDHVSMDFGMSPEDLKPTIEALRQISQSPFANQQKLKLSVDLLANFLDRVHFLLEDRYGKYDSIIFRVVRRPDNQIPIKFIDATLRSNNAIQLANLISKLATLGPVTVAGESFLNKASVDNKGFAIGILRLDPNPLELTGDDIGVFDRIPTEASQMAGVISLAKGARLSHIQLLAKSLHIPNVSMDPSLKNRLQKFDGKRIILKADSESGVTIEEATENSTPILQLNQIEIPIPNHSVSEPVSLDKIAELGYPNIAGPKALKAAKIHATPEFAQNSVPGEVLPFGFFHRYAESSGLKPLIETLQNIKLTNRRVVAALLSMIRAKILSTPLNAEDTSKITTLTQNLVNQYGSTGAFFRSDTHLEDLKGFNGAGLNTSVPNVSPIPKDVNLATRQVYLSPFTERSVYWRGAALHAKTVPIAEPSVLIMPTVNAKMSGVIWFHPNETEISVSNGISGVVSTHLPVDEYWIPADGSIYQKSFRVSNAGWVTASAGGLTLNSKLDAKLTPEQIQKLQSWKPILNRIFGESSTGWDVEFATTSDLVILQARPAPED